MKWTVHRRLAAGFATLLVLTAAMGTVAVLSMQELADATRGLHRHPFTVTNNVRQVNIDVQAIELALQEQVLARDAAAAERARAGISRREASIEAALALIDERYLGDRADIQSLRDALAQWTPHTQAVQGLIAAARFDEAGRELLDESHSHAQQVHAAINRVGTFANGRAVTFAAEAEDSARNITAVSIGLVITTIAAGGLLAFVTSRAIRRTIGPAIATMSTSSTEIAATVEAHENTVNAQAAEMGRATAAIGQLRASAHRAAEQAEATARAARQVLETGREGKALASQAARSMDGMKEKVGSVAGQILRLSEQAGQIGGIARVVGELASQTNMLALNAAVEAARAGEHGKGFAIVAAEVRKLAEQSRQSAERANALVGEIQMATNEAVMVTEDGTRTAVEASALSRRASEALDSITGMAEESSANAQQALLDAQQQSMALGQMTEAMTGLSAGSAQMAAGTAQTRIGVQRLESVAKSLEALA